MTPPAEDRPFSSLPVGTKAAIEHTISQTDVSAFAELSGDHSPLHIDEAYAKGTTQGKVVVHGMLLGALVSQLIGMHLPGTRALLLEETLTFKKPVHINDMVKVEGEVLSASASTHILEVGITISVGEMTVVIGKVLVQVRE
jgi:3-hydroxybutyryl-CoA dehydratase